MFLRLRRRKKIARAARTAIAITPMTMPAFAPADTRWGEEEAPLPDCPPKPLELVGVPLLHKVGEPLELVGALLLDETGELKVTDVLDAALKTSRSLAAHTIGIPSTDTVTGIVSDLISVGPCVLMSAPTVLYKIDSPMGRAC